MVFVFLCLDDVHILSDVVVVRSVIHCSSLTLQSRLCSSLNGEKVIYEAVGESSSSLHIEECDFTWLILSKIFYLVLSSCMNYHLTAKYKTEKRITK